MNEHLVDLLLPLAFVATFLSWVLLTWAGRLLIEWGLVHE